MVYKETFWMACDSTDQLRAEYGPFHTRGEAEHEAGKLGFHFILRYEHMIGEDEDIKEVRCVFIELQSATDAPELIRRLHTRCASCGESSVHDQPGWLRYGPISMNLNTPGTGFACLSRLAPKA